MMVVMVSVVVVTVVIGFDVYVSVWCCDEVDWWSCDGCGWVCCWCVG